MKMCHFFLLIWVFSVFSAWSGADSMGLKAKKFPDHHKLLNAITVINDSLEANPHMDATFRMRVADEMDDLLKDDDYRIVPSLVLLGRTGHGSTMKDGSLAGMGAVTDTRLGATIYFSEKSLTYDDETFTRLLLHEILHHVVEGEIAKNEDFIEDLALSIMQGRVTLIEDFAVKKGVKLQLGSIYAHELFDAFFREIGYHCPGDMRKCELTLTVIRNYYLSDVMTPRIIYNESRPISFILNQVQEWIEFLEKGGWKRENYRTVGTHETLSQILHTWLKDIGKPYPFEEFYCVDQTVTLCSLGSYLNLHHILK